MLERTNDKIDDNIPNNQAAYRGERSTTEQMFTIKLMAEKAIIKLHSHVVNDG